MNTVFSGGSNKVTGEKDQNCHTHTKDLAAGIWLIHLQACHSLHVWSNFRCKIELTICLEMSSQKSPHGNPKHIYTYIYIYAPDAASKQVIFSSFKEGKKTPAHTA